ncbi:MAG: hypothetical protein ACE5GB_00740 [Acidimicrobiales bacterium]
MSRFAGPIVAVGAALAWVALAWRTPTSTFHFAPTVVAAGWGWVERWSTEQRRPGLDGWSRGIGGVGLAVLATLVLWAGDGLRGPTFWHARGGADVAFEHVVFALLGGSIGAWFALRPERATASGAPRPVE